MRWRWLRWAWCAAVLAVTVLAAPSGAAGRAVTVSCARPTRLSACGLRATLLPPPPSDEAGAGCASLCAGRALLEWAPGRWSPCAPLAEESGEHACAGAWGAARVLVRCGVDSARARVACDGLRRVRRDGEAEDAAPATDEAGGEGEAEVATEVEPMGEDAGAEAGAEGEGDAGDAPVTDAPTEPPTEAPAPAAPEEDDPPPADPTEEAPAEAATAPAPVDTPEDATTALAPGDGEGDGGGGDGDGGGGGDGEGEGAGAAEAEPSGAPDETPHEWENTLTIVLGALVAVLLVGVAVGGFVLWRWRRRGQALGGGGAGERAPGDGAEEKPLSRRVAASALEAYVADALRSEELRDQHALLPRGCVRPALCGRRPDNRRRNRYNDLVAYDETRVVLLPFPGEDPLTSDYINANYVDGYARAKEFIAAQAPTAATAADWWRLVWQERVRVVVALCALREAGLEKCFQYWPSAGSAAAHGPVAVTCAREDAFPDFVVRELRAARGDQTRQVVQVQFTAWPDHGVPRHPEAVTALLRRVARLRAAAAAARARAEAAAEGAAEGGEGPLLVHCSAGVGRTGTVLLALQALEQARAEGAVDMLALLQQLRRQRPNLVDSPEQYEAAHRILVEALLGAPLALAADASLGARVREAAASGELRAQWRRLEPGAGDALSASASSASSPPGAGAGTGAPPLLELDGFRARARFVAAPAASPASAWRQVVARGLRVAVLLQDPPEGEGAWPADPATADVGVRVVDADARVSVLGPPPAAATAHGDVLEQRLELRAAGVEGRSLRLLRSRARWPASADVPEGGPRPLLRLLRAATAAANAAATSAAAAARASAPAPAAAAAPAAPEPVLLLCADGRRGCGLLAALSALLEQLQAEGECCVAEAVHAVRRAHDHLICSEEQLLFLYEAAVAFVEDSLAAGNPR